MENQNLVVASGSFGFLDTETGGYSKEKNGVCEIAIVATDENLNVLDVFHHYIKPYKRPDSDELVSYKDDAMAINGLSEAWLAENGKDVRIVMQTLAVFMFRYGITKLVAHNAKTFDIPRLVHLFERFHPEYTLSVEAVDTLPMARKKLPSLTNHKLPDLCVHYKVVNSGSHTAKGDAFALLEVYKCLIQ